MSRLPDMVGGKRANHKFKRCPIGYCHIDNAEVCTEAGKLYLFAAIDRTSKFVDTNLLKYSGKLEAAQFLLDIIAAARGGVRSVQIVGML